MNRIIGGLILTTICVSLSGEGLGQGPAQPKPREPEPTETVIRLKVQAAAAPKPALKYLLLPELREMNPGNPILGYLKCFPGHANVFFGKQSSENLDKWLEMPLKDLPVATLREYYGGPALRNVDAAARLDHPDWQALVTLKNARNGSEDLRFGDLQRLRGLAWFLRGRMRGEIAERRFNDAVITAQTLFAMARHAAEHPTSIGLLVAVEIGHGAALSLDEMLSQPGCPNLFWALADLPHPFADMHLGLRGDRIGFMREFGLIDDKARMTEAEVLKVVDRFQAFDRLMWRSDLVKRDWVKELRGWLVNRSKDAAYVDGARKRLVEYGNDESAVKRFSALQVVFLDEKRSYIERRDEETKELLLPYWEIETPKLATPGKNDSPFLQLVAQYDRVRVSQARLEQRLALLSCVEALRLHAAEHNGNLPAHLADVDLPLPIDQYTGKSFQYKLDGDTAFLRGAPRSRLQNYAFDIRYEVTITK